MLENTAGYIGQSVGLVTQLILIDTIWIAFCVWAPEVIMPGEYSPKNDPYPPRTTLFASKAYPRPILATNCFYPKA